MMLRCLLAFALVLAATASTASAEPVRVVVVKLGDAADHGRWPAMEERLVRELELTGLKVISHTEEATGQQVWELLPKTAAALRAAVAVHLVKRQEADRIRVGVHAAFPDRMVVRTIEARGEANRDKAAEVALKVAELIHANLVELELVPAVQTRPIRSPRPAKPKPRNMFLGAGVGLELSNRQLDPLPGLVLSWGWWLGSSLQLESDLFAAVLPASLSSAEGEADAGTVMIRALVSAEPWRRWPVSPRLGLGVGGVLLWAHGEARQGQNEGLDGNLALLLVSRFALRVRLTRRWSLDAAGSAMLSLPELHVDFGDQRVASLGKPIGFVELNVLRSF